MDEKNHVARNANKELRKQIQRLETAYSYVQNEISEDTRMGNLHHWAYSNKATAKAAGSERPRREAANRDRHNEEATGMRKQRRNQADHDDETRTRKGPGRGRAAEANVDTGVATKRRKVEKTQPAASSAAMERTASTNTNSGRGGAKDTDKRKNRGANAATAATAQRKRYVPRFPILTIFQVRVEREEYKHGRLLCRLSEDPSIGVYSEGNHATFGGGKGFS